MNPDLQRYSCQIALPGFGEAAQQRLQQAKVLIIGAGGLGCPVGQYLAAAGIGTLGIADYDTISTGNLHRQILYDAEDVGKQKALIACERLLRQNPGLTIVPHTDKITSLNIVQVIKNYDFIVDCTDNFDTRFLINDACVLGCKPLVYGAIYQYEGQVAVWNMPNADGTRSPNYRDLYPQVDATQIPNCSVGGVIPTLAGIIGSMQANEVIKVITQTEEPLIGKVLVFDALSMQSRIIKIGVTTKTDIRVLQQTIEPSTFTAAELQKQLKNNEIQLIDVRTLQERDLYDIGGDHIPLDELQDEIHVLQTGKTVVFYCATGKRSAEAVKLVNKLKPDINAVSLQGGLSNWAEIGE
ncbi:HesA/MoeB/ThiF family protein [Mucilaginibacter psychrotolerans]|uniref:Molybdopterin-synthase adenylyltransferase n=1 Tax=Mucilaginibacter psychrotolerans TaxID=1524096 RepID=A0A4Y8SLL2_9SPHI|nr:HesA/MoeB/ThiF family protein [Mucilaginibacter psychrotolerans]TFF39595.1 thiamine biosynthesis protein [Mucilaginibacter psychrotolerans]